MNDSTPSRSQVFPVGPPVAAEHQAGRLGNIERLAVMLRGGDHVVLSDVRRAGKSTVALAALEMLEDDTPTPVLVAVDLHERIDSSDRLAQEIAEQVALQRSRAALTGLTARRFGRWLWGRAKGISVPGVTDQEEAMIVKGAFELLSSERPGVDNVAAALEDAERLAADRESHLYVFIDEAQELMTWPDAQELQKELRKRMRDSDRRTTYLFAGSEPSMVDSMFAPDGLLEFDGQHLPLSPLLEDQARDDLRRSFGDLGFEVDPRSLDHMLTAADGRPVRLMLIASRACSLAEVIGQQLVDTTILDQAIVEARQDRLWQQGGAS
jgi:hypothetical protein